ncbi:hypothetical protein DFH06DRAFT_1121049 [Mycena polygramma]|nr:hypothetical protein DFH06DRAFT_1121049 [Mycena polygramma]
MPYLNKQVAAAVAVINAARANRPVWIDNAIANGPLPVHLPAPPSAAAQITDADPTPEELHEFSVVLAHSNQTGTLVTLANKGDKVWTELEYPYYTTAETIHYVAPSGFRNLADARLPKCAHFSNPFRSEAECTMRPHTRQTPDGPVVFLQVDTNHHACPFIAVIRKRKSHPLHAQRIKAEVKAEPKAGLLLPPKNARPTAKEGVLGRRRPALSRQNALASLPIAGPSGVAASRGAGPSRPSNAPARVVIDVDALDDTPPSSSSLLSSSPSLLSSSLPSSSPPTSSPWSTRPFISSTTRKTTTLYTAREAFFNAVGSDALKSQTALSRAHLAETKDYTTSPWLVDGPDRKRPSPGTLIARLIPYASGGELADRIAVALPVGPAAFTQFLVCVATTDGVSGEACTAFFNMVRQCDCCKLQFTPFAYNQHLYRSGNVYLCRNHPAHNIVSPVVPGAYGELVERRRYSLGHHPAKRNRVSPYREYGSLTALGIALSALDTRLGLPDDIFQAVRVALVPCADCARFRTVHAHLAHLAGGVCSDIGPGESSFIAVSSDRAMEVDGAGKRTTILIPEDAQLDLDRKEAYVAAQAAAREKEEERWAPAACIFPFQGTSLSSSLHQQPPSSSLHPHQYSRLPSMATPQPQNNVLGEQEFVARRVQARHDLLLAQQALQAAPPASRGRALNRVAACRRVCVSLSSVAAPTSSDEEIGRVPLFSFQRRAPNRPQPEESSSDDEYYSSSSTSSGGSHDGDVAAQGKIWAEYQRWPGDVVFPLATAAQQPGAVAHASTSRLINAAHAPRAHAAECRSLRDKMGHCDCPVRAERLERRKARKDARLRRWFATKVAEEGGADGDHEGDGAAPDAGGSGMFP